MAKFIKQVKTKPYKCTKAPNGYKDCKVIGQPLHTCPYSMELYGDSESLCNCCANCEYQCAMDV